MKIDSKAFSDKLVVSMINKIEEMPYQDLINGIKKKAITQKIQIISSSQINNACQKLQKDIDNLDQNYDVFQFCKELKRIYVDNTIFLVFEKYWKQLGDFIKKSIMLYVPQKKYDQNFLKKQLRLRCLSKLEQAYNSSSEFKKDSLLKQGFGSTANTTIHIMFFLIPLIQDHHVRNFIGGGDNFYEKKKIIWKNFQRYLASESQQQSQHRFFQFLQRENCQKYFQTIKSTLASKCKQAISQIIPINHKMKDIIISYDILLESINATWHFFRNVLQKTLKSKTKYSDEKTKWIKKLLNSKEFFFPGILIGRITSNYHNFRIYFKKEKNVRQIQKMLGKRSNLFEIIDENTINNISPSSPNYQEYKRICEELKIEKTYEAQYYVKDLKLLEEEINFQVIAYCINFLRPLIDILEIKAIIFGDVSIEGSQKIFLPKHNRIYLKNEQDKSQAEGFQRTFFSPLMRGNFPYFCPGGWLRLSLNVAESQQDFDNKYGNWRIAYHGTGRDFKSIFSILTTGFRCATGCGSPDKPVTYLSPSIEYAAQYSGPYYDKELKKWVAIVLQVRVDPNVISKTLHHTLPGTFKGDPNFQNQKYRNEYQWLINGKTQPRKDQRGKKYGAGYFDNILDADGIIPYGIMIRLSDTQPKVR